MATTKTKASSKKAATAALAQVAKGIMDEIEADHVDETDYTLGKTNADGKMLMVLLTLQPRERAPNPMPYVINEQIFWVPRGVEVTVPWFVVTSMKNNVETRFRKGKDPDTGKNIVEPYQMPSEPFSYQPINPAPGVTL
jgi:hypothetical protein